MCSSQALGKIDAALPAAAQREEPGVHPIYVGWNFKLERWAGFIVNERQSLIGKVERYFQWVSGPCVDLVMWFEDLVCWWHCLGSWEVEPGYRKKVSGMKHKAVSRPHSAHCLHMPGEQQLLPLLPCLPSLTPCFSCHNHWCFFTLWAKWHVLS